MGWRWADSRVTGACRREVPTHTTSLLKPHFEHKSPLALLISFVVPRSFRGVRIGLKKGQLAGALNKHYTTDLYTILLCPKTRQTRFDGARRILYSFNNYTGIKKVQNKTLNIKTETINSIITVQLYKRVTTTPLGPYSIAAVQRHIISSF